MTDSISEERMKDESSDPQTPSSSNKNSLKKQQDYAVSLNEGHSIHSLPFSPRPRRFPASAELILQQELSALEEFSESPGELQERLNLILMDSAKENLPDLVQSLLTAGFSGTQADSSFQAYKGKTALHLSSEAGHVKVCEVLISFGNFKTLDVQDDLEMTPLHYACKLNRGNVVRLLTRSGASLNVQDRYGNSPIHYIASNRNIDLFQFLLRRDANLRLVNYEGHTPIELAKITQLSDQVCLLNVTPAPFRPLSKVIEDEDDDDEISFSESSIEKSFDSDKQTDQTGTDLYDFEVIRPLKKLSYGEIVYLVKNTKTGKMFCMKVIRKSKLQERSLYMKYAIMEKKVLVSVSNPFISKLRYTYQSDAYLYLILDYCKGGDVAKYLAREGYFNEDRACLYLAEAILAIDALHSHNIIYRNLKTKNVEIDESGHIKLTNFGFAKDNVDGPKRANSFFLSISRLPPEVLNSEGHGKAVDWYMAGVLLFEMLSGRNPFFHENKNVMTQRIKVQEVSFPNYFSENAKDLIRLLLDKNPDKRIGSANGSKEIRSHPFFENIDWKLLYKKQVVTPPVDYPEPSLCSFTESFFSRNSSIVSQENSYIQGWDYVSP